MKIERLMRYLPRRQKKSSSTAAMIPVARILEMKKKNYAVKLEGIQRTMT